MFFQNCAVEVDMIYLKQTSEKWNVSFECEKQHKTEIRTCETNWNHFILFIKFQAGEICEMCLMNYKLT